MPSCIICNKEGAKFCKGCHSAGYCSKHCQANDFPTHKMLCSTFKGYQDRAHENLRRGIVFHETEKPPQWVWIELESKDGSQHAILEHHLKASSYSANKVQYISMQHNKSRKRALQDTLTIIYCDKAVQEALGPNRSIQALGNGAPASPWYGPIIVVKKLGLETDPAIYGDMELTAYRDVLDSLIHDVFPTKIAVSERDSKIQSLHSGGTVRGVRVSCQGDIRVFGANKYIPVNVSIFDPVFVAEKPGSSELLGVPVRVRKIPPHPAWKYSGIVNISENQVVTRLFRQMDPEHDDFGLAPMRWDLPVGSVLVVRDNGKDITPQQVEALCYYVGEQLQVQEMLTLAVEHRYHNKSSVAVKKFLALFTSHAFRNFFADFKAEKEVDDPSWMIAESPV